MPKIMMKKRPVVIHFPLFHYYVWNRIVYFKYSTFSDFALIGMVFQRLSDYLGLTITISVFSSSVITSY